MLAEGLGVGVGTVRVAAGSNKIAQFPAPLKTKDCAVPRAPEGTKAQPSR
ncbi:hypothetical protein GCM10010372_66660 [Streptomyces tauricus]|nr:hypothetical protein GCM10010372_66660 [Streptomyces tauricus]